MPRVGTFAWDFGSPSYLTSVLNRQKDKGVKPGWVVCDVLLIENVQLKHVEPFLHKVRTLDALKNIGRTMFMLIAQGYETEAFKTRDRPASYQPPKSLLVKTSPTASAN